MSWETAINGYFQLNPSLSREEANSIINELKDLLEVESLELSGGLYFFKSLNFTSHIEPNKLKEKFREYKEKISSVSLSIWFLHEPDWYPVIDGEIIKETFLKFKDSIEHVRFDLWFLSDPDVEFEMLEGQVIIDKGIERKGD